MNILKVFFITLFVFFHHLAFAFDSSRLPKQPDSSWELKEKYSNFMLFKKKNESTYIQVVDIKGGALISSLTPGYIKGTTDTNPSFNIKTLDEMWKAASYNKTSIINGQFFAFRNGFEIVNPTTLAYDVKGSGKVLAYGYGDNLSKKQIEFFDNVGVAVYGYDKKRIETGTKYSSKAQNIIVGLDPSVDKDKNSSTGRFYMCTKLDNISTQLQPWLVTYHAVKKTQAQAYSDITSWNCTTNTVIMFDGSNSVKLKTKGMGTLISEKDPIYLGGEPRKIPHALVIYNSLF